MNHTVIGKIKSLALTDFLTYDELKFYPGDHLNILTGPNGTGKSSIVAAIILGCGGEPALLSRSKSVAEYVKNGKNKARIEIDIISNAQGAVVTFNRVFSRDSKEIYKINGTVVSRKEYLRQIKLLNIQVDNLCMFLPQDRVQDFTKMNPQQLLHNTQLSVCKPEITEAFEKLLDLRKTQKSNAEVKGDLQTRLRDSINRKVQLQAIIESNRLKDQLEAKLQILMKKKAWLEYGAVKVQLQEVEADLKTLTEKIRTKNLQIEPFKAEQERTAEIKTTLKNAISKAGTSLSSTVSEMDKLNDGADKVEGDINQAKRNLRNVMESVRDQKKQIGDMQVIVDLEQNDLQEAQNLLAEFGNVDEQIQDIDKRANVIKAQQEALMKKRNGFTKSLEEQIIPSIRLCERKIAMISDTQKQRVDALRNNFEDTYKAYMWLQSHRDRFRGRVFNPIMIEITVNQKANAKYIENTIGLKDLTAFVCTNKDDMKELIKKFRNEMNLQVNVAFSEDTDEINFTPDDEIAAYPPELGLYSYLIDMFKGPAPIMNYLCSLYKVHMVAVGDDNTFTNASRVPNEFRLFFSTNHRFQINISRYSQSKSTLSSAIQDRNILNVDIDTRMKKREEQNLEKWKADALNARNNRSVIEDQIKNNEQLIAAVRSEKAEIQKKIKLVSICSGKLQKKKAEFEALKNRNIDVEGERNKFKIFLNTAIAKLDTVNEKRIGTLTQYKNHHISQVLARKKLQLFDASTGNVDDEIRKLQNELQNSITLRERIKDRLSETIRRCKKIETDALALTDGLSPDHPKFKYKNDFNELSDDIEELLNNAGELQGRIDCMRGVDLKIVNEHETLTEAIRDMENQLTSETQRLDRMEEKLDNLHQLWYPAVAETVDIINEKFSNFFTMMGFVGEVELIRKEERDYADYGIAIRVQYRDNEKLRALTRFVQSGGERAVAIAVYTLSLQHMTSVPFRCVDEINQGMDPKNERKIFQMLVDITCQPDQSQYFFVTPKLLSDLPFSDYMEIHVVHNGKYIDDSYIFLEADNED